VHDGEACRKKGQFCTAQRNAKVRQSICSLTTTPTNRAEPSDAGERNLNRGGQTFVKQ